MLVVPFLRYGCVLVLAFLRYGRLLVLTLLDMVACWLCWNKHVGRICPSPCRLVLLCSWLFLACIVLAATHCIC